MTEIGADEARSHLPALLARKSVAQMRKLRRALAARGVRLCTILEEGESLRDLAHSGHRHS